MGRPPTDNPRNLKIEIRLNEEESNMLDYCHKTLGKPRSEIIRQGIKETYTKLIDLEKK